MSDTPTPYAVVATGGTQFRMAAGAVVRVNRLDGEPGSAVEFPHVLLLSGGSDVKVGAPYVTGAKVTGEIVRHFRGKKIRSYRFKRKKGYQRTVGHRQDYTAVKITGVVGG